MTSIDESLSILRTRVAAGLEFATHPERRAFLSYVDEVVLPALVDVLERLVLNRHRVEEKQKLAVHYTSMPRLVSILKSGSIRPYDSNQSNDPNEGRFFSKHFSLPDDLSWMTYAEPSHAYIASFVSAAEGDGRTDDLVYWRTYGYDGMGCSIAMTAPQERFYRVLYGPNHVQTTQEALIPILEVLTPLAQVDDDMQRLVAREVWKALGAIRFLYKSEEYEHEQESRFVVPNVIVREEEISFGKGSGNENPNRIRHYYNRRDIDLRILLQSSSSITLGPTLTDTTEVKRAIRILLRKLRRELESVPVTDSKIVYRGT